MKKEKMTLESAVKQCCHQIRVVRNVLEFMMAICILLLWKGNLDRIWSMTLISACGICICAIFGFMVICPLITGIILGIKDKDDED